MAITPFAIETEDQIYLCGSPIHIAVSNSSQDTSIVKAEIELYIWSGQLNNPPSLPNYILESNKVSQNDTYISFQIAEKLEAEIDNTRFAWVQGSNFPEVRGEGVFWQIKKIITNTNGTEIIEGVTNFTTRGYRYDFEQVGNIPNKQQPYLGLKPIDYNRYYTDKIKYVRRSFDFTQSLANCTSENIIKKEFINPTECKAQLGERFLIVYLNRWGLFDYFTPYGKVTNPISIDSEDGTKLYRNPNAINNSIIHHKRRLINEVALKYVINTGGLHENMVEQVEEVMYSPLIYLVKFTGETFTTERIGLTVDSTTISVDSTEITVDAITITVDDVGLFSEFQQIPVINANKSFDIKTRLTDKGKINYDLEFESGNRINNLK
jgi:hypothetical protein